MSKQSHRMVTQLDLEAHPTNNDNARRECGIDYTLLSAYTDRSDAMIKKMDDQYNWCRKYQEARKQAGNNVNQH